MTYQIISPFVMPIDADDYKEAVKKFVKFNRDISINQLIVADQLNNNRMLANIKYYQDNGRNKISANFQPTLLNEIPQSNGGGFYLNQYGLVPGLSGMMTPGSNGMVPVGPINPNGMVPVGPINPNGMGSVGSFGSSGLISGLMSGMMPFIGPSAETEPDTGTVFPLGTVITKNDTINPGAADFPKGTTKAPTVALTLSGYSLNNDTVLPTNTFIQKGTILVKGTNINRDTTFPRGTVLKQGCNFPSGTFLPKGTIFPLGTIIDLTNVANDITAPSGGLNAFQLMQKIPFGRCRLTRNAFLPEGGVLKVGFKFTSGSVIVDGTVFNAATNPSVFPNGSEIVGPVIKANSMNPMSMVVPYGMGPVGMPGLPAPMKIPAGFPVMGLAESPNYYNSPRHKHKSSSRY